MTTTTLDRSAYTKMEARMSFRAYHMYGLILLLLIGLASSLLLPMMPQTVYDLLTKGFQMKNWTQVIVFNDFISVFAIAFWIGIFDLFRIYILPTEERYLDIFLSKPLPRSQYLLARLLPTFGYLLGILLLCSLFYATKIALINGTTHFNALGFFLGMLVTAALTLFLLAVANYIFLFFKEMYHAIIVAFGIWLVPILPTAIMVYRPDQLVAKPQLKWFLYPANLLWFEQNALLITVITVPLFLLGAAGMVWLAVRRMETTDLL